LNAEDVNIQIRSAGNKFFTSLSGTALKLIASDLMRLNTIVAIGRPDSEESKQAMKNGFTDQQKKWLEDVNKILKEFDYMEENCPEGKPYCHHAGWSR